MPKYEVREKTGRQRVVYRYEYDAPLELKDFPNTEFVHVELPPPAPPPDPVVQAATVLLTVAERDQIVSILKRVTALLENAEVIEKPKSEIDAKDPVRTR